MMRLLLACAFMFASVQAGAEVVPSGQPVRLYEALVDEVDGQNWLRMRFVAPDIARDGGTIDYEKAEADMAFLCSAVGLPFAQKHNLKPHSIVISLSDRETEFGVQNADATQFFDAFRIENDACIWEAF